MLRLSDLPWREWPPGIRFVEDLEVENLPFLVFLPASLSWMRMHLKACRSLQSLHLPCQPAEDPEGLWAPRWTNVEACQTLRTLSASGPIQGGLRLRACPALEELGPDLRVITHDLKVADCPSLTRLPQGLRTGGDLHLTGVPHLRTLPEGIRVGGRLVW